MTSLSRADVLAIAAHVQAGNVDGCAEDLLVKLRAFYRWIPPRGCWAFNEPHEPGAPDTVVVDPTISAEAGDGGHAAQGDPARPTFGPETAPSPAAADSRSTSTQRGEKPSPCGSDVGGCSSDDTASYRLGSTSSARPGGERQGAGRETTSRSDEAGQPSATESPAFDPASPPAAADSPITVAGGRVTLRNQTIDAIFSGGAGMPDPEQQLNKRRRARTRAV